MSTAVGLGHQTDVNIIIELELTALYQLTWQSRAILSMEGAAFQKVPKNTSASELATANGDVSQGSLGRAVFFPLWYIHTTP